jgi:hypothetical protein
MFRLRFAIFAAATGTGLLCGCLNLFDHHHLFGHRETCAGPDCCAGGLAPDQEGPIVDNNTGAVPVLPGGPGAYPPPPGQGFLAPQNTVPQLNPTPRLVPQPQAPIMPYTPSDAGNR